MGYWGYKSYDNDYTSDFIDSITNNTNTSISKVLTKINKDNDYPDGYKKFLKAGIVSYFVQNLPSKDQLDEAIKNFGSLMKSDFGKKEFKPFFKEFKKEVIRLKKIKKALK